MAFFENLSKKVGEAAQATAKKSTEIYETTKINMAIGTEEDKIQKAYAQIGKMVYENRDKKLDEIKDCVQIFSSIEESEKAIKDLKEKLLEIKNEKICGNCGNVVDRSVIFCDKCGTKIETPLVAPKVRVCSDCGTPISEDVLFCSKCGKKVE